MSLTKKIYLCITPFFPSISRWQGAYVLDQVKAIQRNSDYEVVVFKTNTLSCKEEDYDVDGVHVYAIRPLLMPSYILNGLTEGIVGRLFVRKLRSVGIDPKDVAFVHCHTANHAAFGFGVKQVNPDAKVMIQFHDLDPYTLRNGKWADKRWNVRYRAKKSLSAFNRADLLISISTPVQENLLAFPKARPQEINERYLSRLKHLEDFLSVRPNNTYILYNGVDTGIFNGNGNDNGNKTFRIGCIGNFQIIKDHISLIKAFEIVVQRVKDSKVQGPELRLSLLGSGETKEMCVKYLEEHGLMQYVEWPKEVSHEKLPEYYRSLDLFVLPSVYEGFGCVYTEAYACGVPFICCEGQGAAEYVAEEEKCLWLVKPHSPKEIAERIERYYVERNKQTLRYPYDIDELIYNFLQQIDTLIVGKSESAIVWR